MIGNGIESSLNRVHAVLHSSASNSKWQKSVVFFTSHLPISLSAEAPLTSRKLQVQLMMTLCVVGLSPVSFGKLWSGETSLPQLCSCLIHLLRWSPFSLTGGEKKKADVRLKFSHQFIMAPHDCEQVHSFFQWLVPGKHAGRSGRALGLELILLQWWTSASVDLQHVNYTKIYQALTTSQLSARDSEGNSAG